MENHQTVAKRNIKYTQLFINNEFVDSIKKRSFQTLNPVDCTKIADVAEADKEDVNVAVNAAKTAFARGSVWRKLDASARGRLIYKLADLIERDIDQLASLETLDNGKPYKDSIFDIQCAIDVFRYYAGYCDKIHGNTIPTDGNYLSLTRQEPVGVVGQIIPWNYPILMVSWKWGPALAAGCTIVLKPAEQTPLTALALAALSKEAGFPKGVINVVTGFGDVTGAALVEHPDVDKIAFTGSTEVGRKVMQTAAVFNMKRVSLECGGKSPLVVFNDADLDEAVEIAHNAIFANHGQNCCAGSRTYVQSRIYSEFVRRAVRKAEEKVLGNPFEESVNQGPQIDQAAVDKILNLIHSGVREGAKLETGGKQFGNAGYFVTPTVFSEVKDQMTIAKEEIFGPVQCIFKFETLDEAIERANDTKYGLAAGVVTKDINTALVFAQGVQAGSVWINCYDAVTPQNPFGGYKHSGIGRELGEEGIKEYLETKLISISVPTKH
ncbi:retinal dehydrogenase 2 [Agrilus planipennis]|uniref:Retinal dehydrogenase 2 n=1 Tax=Agrilus planipennis TaxID=224129 RepID=A0A1W4X864_AGRPL|nr:retinal dehydrogenase 2 [Agrilus planipennis]